MITVRNRETNLVEEVLGNGSGALVAEAGPRYMDLGLVIEGSAVASGATVWAAGWVDDVHWARNVMLLIQSDQQSDVLVTCRDSSETGGVNTKGVANGIAASSGSGWRPVAIAGASALVGFSAQFAIKNAGASEAANLCLRVQLLG